MLSTEMGVLDSGCDSYHKGSDDLCLICNFTFRVLGAYCVDAFPSFMVITAILTRLNVQQKGLIDTCCAIGVRVEV
jgi:hypothetical protein